MPRMRHAFLPALNLLLLLLRRRRCCCFRRCCADDVFDSFLSPCGVCGARMCVCVCVCSLRVNVMFNLNRTIVRAYTRRQNTRKRVTAVTVRIHTGRVAADFSAVPNIAQPLAGGGRSVHAAAVALVESVYTASAAAEVVAGGGVARSAGDDADAVGRGPAVGGGAGAGGPVGGSVGGGTDVVPPTPSPSRSRSRSRSPQPSKHRRFMGFDSRSRSRSRSPSRVNVCTETRAPTPSSDVIDLTDD